MYFLGSEVSASFFVVTFVFSALFGSILNWFVGPTRHNMIESFKEGFNKAFVLTGILFLSGALLNWFRPAQQIGTFVAPTAIEKKAKNELPLRFDTGSFDEKVENPIVTKITTDYGKFDFSTHGAVLEGAAFIRNISSGKKQEFLIWEKEYFNQIGVAPFTVVLDDEISSNYDLIDHQITESTESLTYKILTEYGSILKKFTISKNKPLIDISITLNPKKSMRPRVVWVNPMTKDLGNYDAMSMWVLPLHGKLTQIRSNSIDKNQGYLQPTIFGLSNKYFLCALINDQDNFTQRAYANVLDENIISYIEGDEVTKETTWNMTFYFGPKELEVLVNVDPRLEGVLDYGFFSFISKPMMRILKYCDNYTHNYGYAILLVTLLLKILLIPFTFRGERKMKEMQENQKRLEYIEKKYKDNPEALQKARADHAIQNGAVMLGGCLPMLIQMPFFVGLNGGLSNSLELYKRPFIGWITDLSLPDSYYILPFLIFIVFLATSINPKKDVRSSLGSIAMALIVSAIFSTMASGLALYMFFNSFLHLLQVRIQKALGL